ncbi:sulfotransferase domain-containing protein [Myxococcota bacterium]|nr:sulfotransferase domain-containing protein [Myxococcota bacterium]
MTKSKLQTIVIVSGPPRSGTSLMMSILGRAGLPLLVDETRPPDASNPNGYYEFKPVRASDRDTQWLERAGGHAVKVIDRLIKTLPENRNYRVIVMSRSAEEVIASQNRMLARLGEEPGALPRPRLEAILNSTAEETRDLLNRKSCFEWISVHYPDLVRSPRKECLRILDFLEFNSANDVTIGQMVAAVQPTLYRERNEATYSPGEPTARRA